VIEAVSVRRFRSLRELHVTGLERLNVVTGSNNSGKTSLLEALFLICGHGNPATTSQLIASRGFAVAAGPTAQDPGLPASEIRDTYWKPLFSDLDMSEPIEVAADVIGLGRQVLTVQLERASTVEVALDRQSGFSSAEASGEGTLLLAFRNGNGGSAERRIRFVRGGIEMDVPNREPPFRAVLLGARSAVGPDEVRQLGRVRKRKQVDVLVEALQVVEPRLVGLEVISGSGPPMSWADVGLEELLPLEVMGGG